MIKNYTTLSNENLKIGLKKLIYIVRTVLIISMLALTFLFIINFENSLFLIMLYAITLLTIIIILFIFEKVVVKIALLNNPDLKINSINEYTFYENYFSVTNKFQNNVIFKAEYQYDNLHKVIETNKHYIIYLDKAALYIVSKDGMDDENNIKLEQLLKNNIKKYTKKGIR